MDPADIMQKDIFPHFGKTEKHVENKMEYGLGYWNHFSIS
jgi:hypothetical protein